MKTLVEYIDDNGITTEIVVIYKRYNSKKQVYRFIDESEEEFFVRKEMVISMKKIKEEE